MHSTMASSAILFILSTILLSLFLLPCTAQEPICPFEALYQLGDSIADTGNLTRNGPAGARSYAARLPYGETYFHRPTGRCSNGLLMIDYFAMALQLPLLNPFLDRSSSFDHGANFAGAGSTALDNSFFAERNIKTPLSNTPLSVQLNWFRTHLNSVCRTNTDSASVKRIGFNADKARMIEVNGPIEEEAQAHSCSKMERAEANKITTSVQDNAFGYSRESAPASAFDYSRGKAHNNEKDSLLLLENRDCTILF